MLAGVCTAQQGFPLRPGEWETTVKTAGGAPTVLLFCYTNETWKKALTRNPGCAIEELSVTSKGMHYVVDCKDEAFQMKGPADLTFDGMEHMTGKASFTMTVSGKTTSTQVVMDDRWKAPACSPNDVNLRAKRTQ